MNTTARSRHRTAGISLAFLAASLAACEGPPPEGAEIAEQDLTSPGQIAIDTPFTINDSTVVDLSDGVDWVHWGLTGTSADRKAGVPVVINGAYTRLQTSGLIAQYQPSPGPVYKWTNGTPHTSAQTRTGIATPTVGEGMKFDVSVPATAHTMMVYVTVLQGDATVFVESPALATNVFARSQRTSWAIPIRLSSSTQPRTIKVGVRLDSVATSAGLVSLNAVKLSAGVVTTLNWVSSTKEITVLSNVPQPPLYQADGAGFDAPRAVLGSSIRVLGTFASSAGIYGYELWRGSTKVAEAAGAHPAAVQSYPGYVDFQEVAVDNAGKRASSDPVTTSFWAWGARDVPMNIPDMTCVDYPLDVASPPVSTHSSTMDLSFTIDHTYMADLEISLINPLGAKAVVASRLGADADGYVATRIISNGGTAYQLAQASPPYSFIYNPQQSMAGLVGAPMSGRWLLHVCDIAPADVGVIRWARLYVLAE
jgi:hypothetical protein